MKALVMLLAMLLSLSVTVRGATNAVPDKDEQNRMAMEAVGLKERGRYAEAEVVLKRLAELQPDQVGVKQMLAEVQAKLKAKKDDPLVQLKRQLESIRMPEVLFREAKAEDVIEYLRTEGAKYSKDKSEINYVWLVPADAKLGPVTLNLHNVPLSDVLRYVTQMAGLRYRLEPNAVVIYPPDSAAPNAKAE